MFPDLKIGITKDSFQIVGTSPVDNEALKSVVIGKVSDAAHFFKKNAGMSSVPGDILSFKFVKQRKTSSYDRKISSIEMPYV